MAYFTNSQRYFFLCPGIPFEKTEFLRLYKKNWNCFYRFDKSNSVESFWKMGCGEDNLFSKRSLPRKTVLQNSPFFIPDAAKNAEMILQSKVVFSGADVEIFAID